MNDTIATQRIEDTNRWPQMLKRREENIEGLNNIVQTFLDKGAKMTEELKAVAAAFETTCALAREAKASIGTNESIDKVQDSLNEMADKLAALARSIENEGYTL